MQGPDVVRPYVKQFQAGFPVAVDRADLFGNAYGLTAIPVSFYVDEVGIVRLRGGAPSESFLDEVSRLLEEPMSAVRGKAPSLPEVETVEELELRVKSSPDDWKRRLAYARALYQAGRLDDAAKEVKLADAVQPETSEVIMTWGMILLGQGQTESALKRLRKARDLDPDNWRIRKQIWAIEHPDKFYTEKSPDYGWQKKTLRNER